jgi:hypothetical protein
MVVAAWSVVEALAANQTRASTQDQAPLLRDHLLNLADRDDQRASAEHSSSDLERLRLRGRAEADGAIVADPAAWAVDAEALAAAKPIVETEARLCVIRPLHRLQFALYFPPKLRCPSL